MACIMVEPDPVRSENCFGRERRLQGHNLVPIPPARMAANMGFPNLLIEKACTVPVSCARSSESRLA